MSQSLPTGLVTFVFTEMEGSTRLLEHLGEAAFADVLGEYHAILREAISSRGGVAIRTVGDGSFIVFAQVDAALEAVLAAQLALEAHPGTGGSKVRVGVGVHTGAGRLGGDDYVGLDVHQASRVCSAAHGGQVVVTQATRDATGSLPEGASWRPLGSHRLKDLGSAVALFQLDHSGLVPEHPPLRTLDRVSHNLPVQLTSFLGRADELATGSELLRRTRLLSITGPGGTGKTRLGYQLAAECLDGFPDGVWVTELATLTDPVQVPAALMAAIGLRPEPGRSATETLVSSMRSREALLVLDNCEHLVTPAAALTDDLLRGCQKLRVLATTREPLRVGGETVWALPPLALPGTAEMPLPELAATDSIALFCERAAEARAGFTLGRRNAEVISSICTRLQGIPLAIELAAARVDTMPLDELAERLANALDLLSGGPLGTGDRQSSLRGAIAWSHDLLRPPEQTLFRRLAVFSGGFTLEAAEAVCNGAGMAEEQVLDALDGLVDRSLVALEQRGAEDGRYMMLETIRAYAAEHLINAGDGPASADAHAAYHAALAHSCAVGADSVAALKRLDIDHANLLTALQTLAQRDRTKEHGQLLADLAQFWDIRGHRQVAAREFRRYLDRANPDAAQRGRCTYELGKIAYNTGDYPEARTRYAEGLAVAAEVGDLTLAARCKVGLGLIWGVTGDYPQARELLAEAVLAAREAADSSLEAQTIASLGNVFLNLGDVDAARREYEHALELARELGDRRIEATCLGNLGHVRTNLGDHASARAFYLETLAIAEELGDRNLEAHTLGSLSAGSRRNGDYLRSRAECQGALAIVRQLGDRRMEGHWLGTLGLAASDAGDHAEARACYQAALAVSQDLGDRGNEGYWIGSLGSVAFRAGDHTEARRRFEEALAIVRELGERNTELQVLAGLGDVAQGMGDLRAAEGHYRDALLLAREIGERSYEAHCLHSLARNSAGMGLHAEARALMQEVLLVIGELGEQEVETLEACAELLAESGRHEAAAETLGAVDAVRGRIRPAAGAEAQTRWDAVLAACQEAIGGEACRRALDRGNGRDWDSAVRAAIGFLDG